MTDSTSHRLALALDLVTELCELPPAQREARLNQACQGDEALRAEVLLLLKHHDAGGWFDEHRLHAGLERVLTEAIEDLGSGAAAAPGGSGNLPARIGHYRVLRLIGEGGMGVVYEAEQANPRRRVALKVVRAAAASDQMRRRFQREAHVLGQLDHPGIARIYEAGVTDAVAAASLPFFAMELIHGEPLTHYAERCAMKTRQRLDLFARVCDAVHYAHGRGVIHRDLKPANILVDELGQPRILDFGVARFTEGGDVVTTLHTHVGQLVGTLAYMSPEQVSGGGDPSAVDARSDVYSLGVVLYELLAGRLPIDLSGRPMGEAIRLIQDQEPSRLSSINAIFRGDVDTIVQKALEKEKARRYASASELAADIRRFLSDEPIVARPISTMYQFRKFARRNKVLVGGVAGIILALAIGLAGMSVFWIRAERSAELAQQRRHIAERETYRASIAGAVAALQNHDVAMARRSLEAAPQALRGWEWRHLHSRLDGSVLAIDIPEAHMTWTFAWFAEEGRRLVTANGPVEMSIEQWNAETGERLKAARIGHSRLYVNPGGASCAWIDLDRFGFEIEHLASGERRPWRIDDELGLHWCVAPAADGRSAAYDFHRPDGTVALAYVDLATGETWRHDGTIYGTHWGLDVHSSGVVAIYNNELVPVAQIWRPRTGELLNLEGHAASLTHACLSPDGALLATTARDNTVRLWDVAGGAPVAVGRGHTDVRFAAFSPTGDTLATCGPDRTIRIWSVPSLEPLGVLSGHESSIVRLAFSPDGARIVSICREGIARVWPIASRADLEPFVLRGHTSYVYPVAFSPDARASLIASGGWDQVVRLWHADTLEPTTVLEGCPGAVRSAAFSADGRLIAGICIDRTLRAWDVATGNEIRPAGDSTWPRQLGGEHRETSFHPSEPRLFLHWTSNRTASYLDPRTGRVTDERVAARPHHGADIVSPDGRLAWRLDAEDNRTLYVVDLESGVELWSEETGIDGVPRFLDSRRLLAVPLDDLNSVSVLNARSGERLGMLRGHADVIYGLAVSPDGTRIATCGRDQSIRLWDTQTYEEVAQLRGHSGYVWSVAFSPDGATLISGSGDGTVRVWDTSSRRRRIAD